MQRLEALLMTVRSEGEQVDLRIEFYLHARSKIFPVLWSKADVNGGRCRERGSRQEGSQARGVG